MQNDADILRRLNELEARVEKLDGKTAIKPTPKPVLGEDGVRITTFAPTSSFVMPNEIEMRQLLKFAVVRLAQMHRAPDLRGPKEAEFLRQFSNAFEALGFISRDAELDKKHAASFWIARAEEILRTQFADRERDIGPAFLAATISHGDIPYNNPKTYPFVQEFGLRDYNMGKPATDAWRQVLAAGKAPEPVFVRDPSGGRAPSSVRLVG